MLKPSVFERRYIKLELTFKERKFSGEDPILLLDFLSQLVEEVDILDIGEGQIMVLIPHLLSGIAGDQYPQPRMVSDLENPVVSSTGRKRFKIDS